MSLPDFIIASCDIERCSTYRIPTEDKIVLVYPQYNPPYTWAFSETTRIDRLKAISNTKIMLLPSRSGHVWLVL